MRIINAEKLLDGSVDVTVVNNYTADSISTRIRDLELIVDSYNNQLKNIQNARDAAVDELSQLKLLQGK